MSKRKPHNNIDGYVAELKSHHPKLPGYFAIFDRNKGATWMIGEDEPRYAVAHIRADNLFGSFVTLSSLPAARAVMKDMAAGGNTADLGQYTYDDLDDSSLRAGRQDA